MTFNHKQFRAPRPRTNAFNQSPFRAAPHALLSESLLLPSCQQPPPMFGPRGATMPPQFFRNNNRGPTFDGMETDKLDYWCETCDRGFRSHNLLQNHLKEHQTCNIDGCTFIAHPKLITQHIQMQHSSGLYKKISKLNDPEEIRKWREERRQRFPTKVNIETKKAAVHEKIERGEKMGLRGRKVTDYQKKEGNNKFRSKRRQIKSKKNEKECPPPKKKHNLPAFGGISQICVETEMEDDVNVENSDFVIDEEIDYPFPNHETSPNKVCGVITQLMADYGSSEEEDSATPELNILKNKQNNSEEEPSVILGCEVSDNLKGDSGDDSGPEEIKTVKSKETVIVSNKPLNNEESIKQPGVFSNKKFENKKREQTRVFRKLPSTLLEKLLCTEIKHERNVTLQCIRHIIKNNYFDKQ